MSSSTLARQIRHTRYQEKFDSSPQFRIVWSLCDDVRGAVAAGAGDDGDVGAEGAEEGISRSGDIAGEEAGVDGGDASNGVGGGTEGTTEGGAQGE